MSKSNIAIPKEIIMDDAESFSPGVLLQMQKVGEELENHRASRTGFVGKIRKIGDGIAAVWHAIKSLVGKKVDDPLLKAACDEYRVHAITEKGENVKKASTFIEQILTSKGGTISRG